MIDKVDGEQYLILTYIEMGECSSNIGFFKIEDDVRMESSKKIGFIGGSYKPKVSAEPDLKIEGAEVYLKSSKNTQNKANVFFLTNKLLISGYVGDISAARL